MKTIKMLVMGLVIGLAIGMWFGVNIGKGRPILSNPFAKEDIKETIKQKVGESIEQLGEDIKGKVKK